VGSVSERIDPGEEKMMRINRKGSMGIVMLVALSVLLGAAKDGRGDAGPARAKSKTVAVTCELGPKATGKNWPQIAAWIEDSEGRYLQTIYVTGKVGQKGLGNGFMKTMGVTVREVPEALPVWAYARGVRYGDSYYPPKEQPLPDAVSGATPTTERFERARAAELPDGPIRVIVELCVSRDGLPSLLFAGTVSEDQPETSLSFVGVGDPEGKSGNITSATDEQYPAGEYVKSLRARVEVREQP
jgi:hypothetical protein